jgi:cytochrome c-type biogenesis protein
MEAIFARLPFAGSFILGAASFFTPCILPLIPAYISLVTGLSVEELSGKGGKKGRVILPVLLFCAGFGLVYTLLGATASFLGGFINKKAGMIQLAGGIFIIVFGMHLTGLMPVKLLFKEKKLFKYHKPAEYIGSFLIGVGFAAGWIPCVGPVLASILIMAGSAETMYKGCALLAVFSAGLSLPFLLTGLAINRFFAAFKFFRKYSRTIEVASGAVLIIIGIMIVSGNFITFTGWMTSFMGVLG